MTAKDLMERDLLRARPGDNVWSALALMREGRRRHALVVDESGRLVGIVSNRDYRRILDRTAPDGTLRGVFEVKIADIMIPADRLVTATPEMTLIELAALMTERKVGVLPVLDTEGRPVGVVGHYDVTAALLATVQARHG
ncbi:MAG: CBS domain-containing protein [Vicinamibacteria bacterium]